MASGIGAECIASLIACEAAFTASTSPDEARSIACAITPSSPASVRNDLNASHDTANPGGTGISAAISSPSVALLPP